MAEDIVLLAEPRQTLGKQVKAMRRTGTIPAVLYGSQVDKPLALKINEKLLGQVVSKAGRNRLIKLTVDGGEPRLVLTRQIQREPISGRILHVDLQQVSMTERITTEVPLVLVGSSPAVQRGEGLLIHGIDTVEIRALPGELAPSIQVDVTALQAVNQSLFVRDLKVSDKIEILTPAEEMVAKIVPVKEEVIVEGAPVIAGEVEVIKKGKIEEEGEEGEAAPPTADKKPAEAKKPEAKKEEKR